MTTVISNYQAGHHSFARPPPSPPMDSSVKCTLPSIQNLLGLADGGSPTGESSPTYSPRSEAPSRRQSAFTTVDSRPGSGYGAAKAYATYPPRGFPPSPPMGSEASVDSRSPLTKSAPHFPSSKPAPTGYYHETTPPLEPDPQRYQSGPYLPHQPAAPPSVSQTPSNYFPQAPGPSPPGSLPAMSAAAPSQLPASGLSQQRALPQSFPPVNVPVSVAPSSGAISWQHHHYLQPSPGHLFPQSQDRYICPTCNKAFSRPSSLRIHSHSHTGEKPFKCSQAGCGKAFSVRSNMKRHERGCHSVEVKAAAVMMQ